MQCRKNVIPGELWELMREAGDSVGSKMGIIGRPSGYTRVSIPDWLTSVK